MPSSVVWARGASGWDTSLAQLFGKGPKFSVVCGSCRSGFSARIDMVNYPVVVCPCGQANRLNLVVA